MKTLILVLSLYLSISLCHSSQLKDIKEINKLNHLLISKDNEFINFLWPTLKSAFKVQLSDRDIKKINSQILNVLADIKLRKDHKLISIMFKNKQYVLSEFNHKNTSFKLNGVKINLDLKKKTLSQNVLLINDAMGGRVSIKFLLINDAYALIPLLAGTTGAVIVGSVLVLALNDFYNSYRLASLDDVKQECIEQDKSILFEDSRFSKTLQEEMESKIFSDLYNGLAKYPCVTLIDKIHKKGSSLNKFELDPICQKIKDIRRCALGYLEKSKWQRAKVPFKEKKSTAASSKD